MAYTAYAIWGNRSNELEDELTRPNEGSGIMLTGRAGFTAVVLVVLFGLYLWTMRANNLTADEGEGLVIDVIGRQWWLAYMTGDALV